MNFRDMPIDWEHRFKHITITEKAFPNETEDK